MQCLRSPDAPGLRAWLPELMDVLSAGCSPPSPCSSPSSPLSSPSLEASLLSALCSSHPSSPPCLVSPLCCCDFTFSLAFSSLFPISPALPLPCYFPSTSAVIGWLFVCTNPWPACIATVISELSLTLRPPICSSAPPTSLVISTFDRFGLWAPTAVDYRTVSHLAHSV